MPFKCYIKPNRTEVRRWKPEDVARVARYAADDGHSVIWIMALVLSSLGLGFLICRLAAILDSLRALVRFIRELSVVFGATLAVRVLIERLKRSRIMRIPLVNRLLIVVVLVLFLLERVLSALEVMGVNLGHYLSAVNFVDRLCTRIGDAGQVLGSKAREQLEDFDLVR